jgi:hypothetical protein
MSPAEAGRVRQAILSRYTDGFDAPRSGNPLLDRWDSLIGEEARRWGVSPEKLKALVAMDSGGDPRQGLVQIDRQLWGRTAAARGCDLDTPRGQLGFAASLLRDYEQQTRRAG